MLLYPHVFCSQMWQILLPFCYRLTFCSEAASVIHCSPIPDPLPTVSTILFSKTYLRHREPEKRTLVLGVVSPFPLLPACSHGEDCLSCSFGPGLWSLWRQSSLPLAKLSGGLGAEAPLQAGQDLNSPLLSSSLSTDPGGWTQGQRPPV